MTSSPWQASHFAHSNKLKRCKLISEPPPLFWSAPQQLDSLSRLLRNHFLIVSIKKSKWFLKRDLDTSLVHYILHPSNQGHLLKSLRSCLGHLLSTQGDGGTSSIFPALGEELPRTALSIENFLTNPSSSNPLLTYLIASKWRRDLRV